MTKNIYYSFLKFSFIVVAFLFLFSSKTLAIVDPTLKENNKIGMHIFDPGEIDGIEDVVNSNGGEWGYVTVVLREDDRNREKWMEFMKKLRKKN